MVNLLPEQYLSRQLPVVRGDSRASNGRDAPLSSGALLYARCEPSRARKQHGSKLSDGSPRRAISRSDRRWADRGDCARRARARELSRVLRRQRARGLVAAAIALEVVLFALLPRVLPVGTPESVRWLWVLMIVGVHFLPMAVSFGPLFLLLGGACISNAALGLLLPDVPFGLFGLVDGVLKVVVGAGSLRTRSASGAPGLS